MKVESLPRRSGAAWLWLILFAALTGQAIWKVLEPPPLALANALPAPPSLQAVRLWDMGEHAFASLWLTIELFSHDEQPGVSLPFKALDYSRVAAWLTVAQTLDPENHNPMLAASQLYSQVPDPERQRIMLDWVHTQFLLDPQTRWPFLAHAALIARHELKDKRLALSYARELSSTPGAPDWARQMSVLLLSDMGEQEQAKILLGGLVQTGIVKDPREIAFLLERIKHSKK